jgi:hypothetical protein
MNAAPLIILIRVILFSIIRLLNNQPQSCSGRSAAPEVVINEATECPKWH